MSYPMIIEWVSGAGDPPEYVRRKLRRQFGTDRDLEASIFEVLRIPQEGHVPLVAVAGHPALDEATAAEVADASACFRRTVDAQFELEPGEKIESDVVTYLAEACGDYPAGTAALRRTTNHGRFVFLAPEVCVVGGRLTRPLPEGPLLLAAEGPGAAVAKELMTTCAKSLGSAIGGKIGAALVSVVFGESDSIDVQQLERDIERIARTANIEQTVNEVNGTVNGILDELRRTYADRKRGGAPKQDLTGLLRPMEHDLSIQIGILKRPEFAEQGLPAFVAAANVMLIVLQEMALADPETDDPNQSSYRMTITGDTRHYIQHVNAHHREMLDRRLAQVDEVQHVRRVFRGGPMGGGVDEYWYFKDHYTGTPHKVRDESNKDKNDHPNDRIRAARANLIASLTNSMTWMDEVISGWRPLVDHPLGLAAAES